MIWRILVFLVSITMVVLSCASTSIDTNDGNSDADADTDSDGDSDGDSDSDSDSDYCEDDPCDPHASCTSLLDTFQCVCDQGWEGDGLDCDDMDECIDETDNCDEHHADCTNTDGSYECDCMDGYDGDGLVCDDMDECTDSTDDCDVNATCTNTDGGFDCDCNPGWEGDGGVCTEIPPEVTIDLTPSTGTLTSDDPYWASKGYRVTPTITVDLIALEWFINQPSGGTISARVYNSTGTLLTSGTTVSGSNIEQWYRSDITYTLVAGQTYTLNFYNSVATTAIFQYKSNPSQPFTVAGYFGNVQSRSSSGDAYPTSDNSWAPFIRVVAVP